MWFTTLQHLFLYFYFFSVAGHFLELIWAPIKSAITKNPIFRPVILTVQPLSPPYGLGAVAVIVFILPLIQQYNLPVWGTYWLTVFITGAVEYISATLIIAVFGHNPFWDYSQNFLNFQGKIQLVNCLLFGLVATAFIYLIYPICAHFLAELTPATLLAIFLTLASLTIIDTFYSVIRSWHTTKPNRSRPS